MRSRKRRCKRPLSEHNACFIDTIARAGASPYFKFFARGDDGNAQHYFDWSNLKNLNYGNPEVQRLVIEAFAHWIREFDIDGFSRRCGMGPGSGQ
jgi:glycosidase